MPSVNYLYTGTVQPNTPGITTAYTGPRNPAFVLDNNLINKLNSISPLVLAQAMPYISLSVLGADGSIIDNLNLSFFQKPIDIANIATGGRFSDRPGMSLQNVEITTDQASGYLYYSTVNISIKIHNPEMVSSSGIMAFLFPGMPILLTYGWSIPLSPDLGMVQESLLLNVVTYDLSFDTTDQITLNVRCMAFNDMFSRTYIGDYATSVDENGNTNPNPSSGLGALAAKISQFQQILTDNIRTPGSMNNNVMSLQAEDFANSEEKVRSSSKVNYAQIFATFNSSTDLQENFGTSRVKYMRFHHLVQIFCEQTFSSISQHACTGKDINVIYGNFNDNAGFWAGRSIADFTVPVDAFKEKLNSSLSKGEYSPTIKSFFETLFKEFLEKKDLFSGKGIVTDGLSFRQPDLQINFTNDGHALYVYIYDITSGYPITTQIINSLHPSNAGATRATASSNASAILDGRSDIPIIKLGHANTFIKKFDLSQNLDENLRSALIQEMYKNRTEGVRSTVVPSKQSSVRKIPLILPLQGSAEVLGHVAWKPFKAFYLSSGIYMVDAIYVITKVSHKLNASGFTTHLDFRYN